MRYSKIITYDTGNCHGYSTTLWVCGCDNKCDGCFNPELWDYNCGKEFTDNTYKVICDSLKKPHIGYFVLLGGEPLSEKNRNSSFNLLKKIRNDLPHIKIVVYTGFTLAQLELNEKERQCIDFLIDGKYNKNLHVQTPQLRGSLNQKCWTFSKDGKVKDCSDCYFY